MENTDNKHDNRLQSVLEQKASLFQSISFTPNNWIWEVDINGVYTYCSNGVFDICGYLPEEIIGKKPSDFLSPEDGILLRAQFQQAILKQQPIKNLELSSHSKDGKVFVFEANGVPYFNDEGKLVGYRGINHDITKRIQVEARLSEDRLMLKTLLESIPDLIWLKDPEGIYLACNPKFERLCGASEVDIIGKTDYDFAPKELADSFRIKDKEAIAANKSSVNLEWVTYADDGHREYIETIKTPMYDSKGKLTGILGIARDITKHKETFDALKDSQSRLSIAMDIARLGTWEHDIKTNNFTVDERFCSIFGTTLKEQGPIESIEHFLRTFIHPEDRERIESEIKKTLVSHDPELTFQGEHRFIHPNGEIRNVLVCFIVSKDENGVPIKTYGVNQDITIVKKAELELKELNASKDKFFSIIAHDLKSPFNTIIGFSDLLKEDIRTGNTSIIETYARIINDSAVQTLRLLENLLEWANSQTGILGFNPTSINLTTLFSEEFGVLNDMASGKDIILSSSFSENLIFFADKNMIRTILRNLISNAIKFTNNNGKVEIRARKKKKQIEFSVFDNGIGITKENLDKLFRIDVSLSTRGTQNENGSGLGLFLCKDFVEKHNGKIWVESEFGKGSVFKFTLPI